jgi:protein phosphatase 2C family protein 2/3
VANALTTSFNDLDERFYDKFGENYVAKKCGSTAVLILIVGAHIFCANVGDSRAVLSSNGKAIDLSLDHKASRKDEVARILEHDGVIEFGRVGAKLAITRAFGDFEFKLVIDENGQEFRKHFITSEPEIRRYDFNPFTDEFIILASDGLFDKFTSQEAVDFIREKMMAQDYQNQDVDKIAKQIAYESIYKKNVRDNTSVLIIALNRGVIE